MQRWRIPLSADGRFASRRYADEALWECSLGEGEPSALTLHTSFGLRVRGFSLFPRFIQGRRVVSDPEQFYRPPRLESLYASYLAVTFAPFSGLEARLEVWVPDSACLVGRLWLSNIGIHERALRVEWAALLRALAGGGGMVPRRSGGRWLLEGGVEGLRLACALSQPMARPVESPYPALALDVSLQPGAAEAFIWVLVAAGSDPVVAREKAQQLVQRAWDAEVARLQVQQAAQEVHIQSGNPVWDFALTYAQRAIWGYFFPGSAVLPHPSFVLTRLPDQGFSPRGDGSDYTFLWNGQTALDAWYVSQVLLPGGVSWVRGLVENFLAVQQPDGFVDWKPGLAGQRSRYLAQPLLATLAWQLYPYLEGETSWWRDIFPHLYAFYRQWFTPAHDRDGDDFPEWDHALQSGLGASPIFARACAADCGLESRFVESPALAALLYREGQSLLKMARFLGEEEALPWLKARLAALRYEIESTWDGEAQTYRYRDAQTHRSPGGGELMLEAMEDGVFSLSKALDMPRRLILALRGGESSTRALEVRLRGHNSDGEVEEAFGPRQWSWEDGHGTLTTSQVFTTLDEVEVRRLTPGDRLHILLADYRVEDISLLLPLWAGVPSPSRASLIVEHTLRQRYLRRFGLGFCPSGAAAQHNPLASWVLMPWNQMLGEGLLRYGYRDLAAELMTRLLNGVGHALGMSGHVWAAYDGERGVGLETRSALSGFPPLGLFLQILGVRALTPERVILEGYNPFLQPITVQYQGIRMEFHPDYTLVTFPGCSTVKVEGRGAQQVLAPHSSPARRSE